MHRRREVVQTIYCDFASMYPTVCTLQGLWRFVIATGVDWEDTTVETTAFLAECDLAALQRPETWRKLPTLVCVRPDADIFPVRASYANDSIATIGLNYLSSESTFWFTLADCVASKLLTGKAPTVERAIGFKPKRTQRNVSPISIAGNADYQINPARDDFYKRLIHLRRSVKSAASKAGTPEQKAQLNSEQLALKILANATSYGIFIEIHVEDEEEPKPRTIHAGQECFQSKPTSKLEVPGKFFHPLLATLITGAARLMLAITERLALYHGLDWAFCDTDSMAFAVPPENGACAPDTFKAKVDDICGWLNR